MSARHAPRHALFAVLALAGCGKASGVELRLHPCAILGELPTSVHVEIRTYDQGGAAIGETLQKSFSVDDPAVFSDDYATIEFVPPAGTTTADFTVTWGGGGVEVVAAYSQVAVPKIGEAIVLGSDECEPPNATEPSSTGTTDEGTSSGTTGTTTSDSSGTSSTTGDATTGTSTTGDGTTDASTSGTSTGTSGGETTGGPQEGDPCDNGGELVCDGGPGVLGQFLLCDVDAKTWKKAPPPCSLDAACPPELGLVNPQLVGCLGDGMIWTCACADVDMMTEMPAECPADGVSKCGETIDELVKVELCVPDGEALVHYVGLCPKCSEDVPGQPLCEQF